MKEHAREPVITGIGVVAAGAIGTADFWELLVQGRSATRRITSLPVDGLVCQVAGEVDFRPEACGLSPEEIDRMDRATQFTVVAGREALADAGLAGAATDPGRIAVALGSSVMSSATVEQRYRSVVGGDDLPSPDAEHPLVPATHDLVESGVIARELAWLAGAEGPVATVSVGCVSGLNCVAHAADLITGGTADVVLTGAVETPITAVRITSLALIGATTRNNADPEHASRPFDRHRDGFVPAEGATVLVVEDKAHALRRGARVYAEIRGTGSTGNAFHMTGFRPDGMELAHAMTLALERARLAPADVDYLNAHGSSTRQNDSHETAAIKRALGPHAHRVPISSIKSVIGHTLGAAAAIEVAASVLAIDRGVVPPTANLHHPDPECELDYVPLVAREQPVNTVLTIASSFGGFQTAMVLTRPRGARS